ncbi:hypothetical protein, variant 1 [Aphanomyces astaci]|nr:hypothetical protein, variant 1 [Aphanomyces astaci]ETV64441.1 hypothetical protein, variant 1 [Aphanomyces astaci]|eukprot:XP_009846072.1 hypothetical protein, variant 1 [Aphanomyces astaci]
MGSRKKLRNSVFSSSDEDDAAPRSSPLPNRARGLFHDTATDQVLNRRGLFDTSHEDEKDLEMKIKQRQMQKKAHWDTLQAKLHDAMLTADMHKSDAEVLSVQLAAALAKVDKRNRQLQNAKSLVHSLQGDLAHLQSLLDEVSLGRRRDQEAWEGERNGFVQEIETLKAAATPKAPPISPTTLLGKVWSRKTPGKEFSSANEFLSVPVPPMQRPAMFTVPVIPTDDEESSDSIVGHSSSDQDDSDSDIEHQPPPSTTSMAPDPTNDFGPSTTSIPLGVSRMNYYMEARMKKEAEKRDKELQEKLEKSKLQEEFDNEWAALARETQELKKAKKLKKPTKTNTRIPRQRPGSFKQQMPASTPSTSSSTTSTPVTPSQPRASDPQSSDQPSKPITTPSPPPVTSPPLPPEPSEADMELYRRQQARLHDLHTSERTKREKAEEADVVRRHLHAAVTQWALGKPLLGLLNSLHEIPELQGVIDDHSQVSNDPDSIKKGYRALIRIIHPDKLRNASVQQQLVANEVFTVVNQAFDGFKQAGGLS